MNKMIKTIVSVVFMFSTSLAIACDYPPSPKDLPNGSTASKEEMLAGVKLIAEYQENMSAYLSCIEAEEVVSLQSLADDDEDGKEGER